MNHNLEIKIETVDAFSPSDIDHYWTGHTVLGAVSVQTRAQSLERMQQRKNEYQMCHELMEYDAIHEGKVILDYGCGPGDDSLGFAMHARPASLIAMDVSLTSLNHLKSRLSLHQNDIFSGCDLRLIQGSNTRAVIPLEDESIDFINCAGVLQHTRDPLGILKEFQRVLKKRGRIKVMVYNYDSIWLHLFLAYVVMIRQKGRFRDIHFDPQMGLRDIFAKTCDGLDCPVARIWKPLEFIQLGEASGLKTEFKGGYFAPKDLAIWEGHPDNIKSWSVWRDEALTCAELLEEHQTFLRELNSDSRGYPLHAGKCAGISGVFDLTIL